MIKTSKRIVIDVNEKFHADIKRIALEYNTTIKKLVLDLLVNMVLKLKDSK